MSCSVLSVVSSIASAGLLGGGGLVPGLDGFDLGGFDVGSLGELGINTDLLDNLSEFDLGSMDDVLGGLGDTFGDLSIEAFDMCGDLVGDVLGDLPDGLSGLIDTDIFSDFALEGLDFAESGSLFDSISGQVSGLLENGVPGFTEIINGAKAFAEQSASALASIQNAANFQIGGQNFNAISIFDQVTGGALSRTFDPIRNITNLASGAVGAASDLLGTVQSSINGLQSQFTSFTDDIAQWGTMYNVTQLDKAFEVPTFVQNLVDQGVPGLSKILEQSGISAYNVLSQSPETLLNAISSVPKNIVASIADKVGFTRPLENLADALIPATVLSAGAIALVKDFKGVSNRLTSVGSTNVQSFTQLGNELGKIKFPESSVLLGIERNTTGLKDVLSANIAGRQTITGTGVGTFNNPTMDDMLGAFTGSYYTPRLIGMLSAQKRLIDTPEGQALKSAIQTAVNNARANLNTDAADAAAIRSALNALLARSDSQTSEDFALLERFQNDLVTKLATEKRNLKAARIESNVVGSLSSVMGFVSSLENAYDDDFNIGYAEWVDQAAGNDQFGDAIRLAMVEGSNKRTLQNIGATFRTTSVFDYADQVAAKRAAELAKCCPPYSELGVYPEAGSLLSTYCENFNLYGIYADGNGMSYYTVIENNSLVCGFTTTTTSTTTTSTSTTSTTSTTTSTSSTTSSTTSTSTSTTSTTTLPPSTSTTTLSGSTTSTSTTTEGPTTTTTLAPGQTTTTSTSTTSTSTSTTSTSTTSTSTTSTTSTSTTSTTTTTGAPTTTTTTTTTAAPPAPTIDTFNYEITNVNANTFHVKLTWTTTGADQVSIEIYENGSLYDSYTGLSADNPTTGLTIPSLSAANTYEAKLIAIRNSPYAETTSSVYF